MNRETRAFLTGIATVLGIFAIGFGIAALAGGSIVKPEIVVGTVVAVPEGSPVARWYVETDRGGIRRLAEVGPALAGYECFEPGDVYVDGSLGRCEGVVWP